MRPEDAQGQSATDDEHDAAHQRPRKLPATFAPLGFSPIVADSGNGAHLLYPLDLPNDDTSKALINGCLAALDFRFSDGVAAVDTSVGNASRIVKWYGTVACKGEDTPNGPTAGQASSTSLNTPNPCPWTRYAPSRAWRPRRRHPRARGHVAV